MSERPDIETIERRAEAATEGPWIPNAASTKSAAVGLAVVPETDGWPPCVNVTLRKKDWEWACHARTDNPALIAYILHLESKTS